MADSRKSSKRPSASKKPKASSRAKAKKPASRKAARKPAAKAPEPKAAEVVEELPASAGAIAALAGKAAMEGTRAAGKAATLVASRVKVPLAVGGGLAAGAAGGLALVRRRNGHRRHGTPDLGPVISAAKRAGSIGEELGRMAAMAEKAAGSKGK